MSDNKDESDNESNNVDAVDSFEKHIKSFGHLYALVVLFLTTIFTRIQGYTELRRGDGWVFLGNDAWYHVRATVYSVENFPSVIGLDAKTGYPDGATPGTFGTLYNFVHAAIAMIGGLGDPSVETVETIMFFSSPVMSAVAVVLVYYVTTYITESKFAGVLSATMLTLMPGMFYQRGLAGFAQHHIAEAILMILSVYLVMRTLEYAEENYVLKEVIRDRESDAKKWAKMVFLAIVAIFAYYLTWPPAIMLFGLTGMAAVIYSVSGFSGTRSRAALMTLTVITGSMLAMVLVLGPTGELKVATPSLLHVGVAGLSFGMSLFVWILTIVSENRNWEISRFVGIISGVGLVSFIGVIILQPSLIDSVSNQILRLFGYPFGLGQGGNVQTIAEESTPSIIELTLSQYGLLLPTASLGISTIIYEIFKKKSNDEGYAKHMYLLVVFIFIMMISFRTARFNYYLAPFVAIVASMVIYRLIQAVDFPDEVRDFAGYHALTIVLLVVVLMPVLFVPVSNPTVFLDDRISAPGYEQWEGPLEWTAENTPDDGVPTYGPYDDSHSYDNESYGVMSWWDYGHWITYTGDRTPFANPFQQNAQSAAEFLLAQNPEEAQDVIEDMGEDSEVDPTVEYVMIDWQMASPISKYPAMEQFHPEIDRGDSYRPYYSARPGQGARLQFQQRTQTYYQTMIGRLFVGHGSAMEASNTTINYETQQGVRILQPSVNPIVEHNTTEEARDLQNNTVEVSRGGINNPPERVEALEHYRLVKSSEGRLYQTREFAYEAQRVDENIDRNIRAGYINDNPSTVKVFQKVDGAKVNGSGFDEYDSLELEVDVVDPAFGLGASEFTYTQRVNVEDGEFNTTLPYSTTGYEDVDNAPEVRGNSDYRLVDSNGEVVDSFQVQESAVVDGGSVTIEADD